MRTRQIIASALSAAMLMQPAVALASNARHIDEDVSAIQQRRASVAYEPTDEIASEYNWEEGDYVFESLRFTGDSADIVHTAEVWGYLSGNYITFYIDHADGTKESIRRLVPKPTGTPGSEDYLSTVTINLTVNDWAVVTGVVEMVDKRAIPGAGMSPTGASVPYLESAYISYGNTLTYNAATAGDSSCSVTLASQNQSDFADGATLSAVPALENPGSAGSVLKRYAKGYCPPADGGFCAGSYEFEFSETDQQDEYPNARTGFKVKVDQKYAGMKAVSYLSYDQLGQYGYSQSSAVHETTIQADGTFVVPFGYVDSSCASHDRPTSLFVDYSDRDTALYGALTINIEPKETLPSGAVVDYNGVDKVAKHSNGTTLAIESSDVNLDIYDITSYGSMFYDFSVSIYPYTDTFGSDSNGHIWYRFDVGKRYAGTSATVKIYRTSNGPDFDPAICDTKTYKVGDDGTFLLVDRIDVHYVPDSPVGANNSYFGAFKLDLEDADPIDIAESATIAAIPDQLWTGKPITPKPIVTSGDTTLVEGVDYEVSYKNNISEGVATAVVAGKGSYTGELSITYLIKKNAGATNPGTPPNPSGPGSSDDPVGDDKLDPDYPVFDSPFSDVSYGAWYYDAVCTASDLGVMNGYDDGTFGPDDPLTREQAAGVLYNYLGEKDVSSPSAPHSDVTQGQWYSSAVNWAIAQDVMGGYGGSSLFGVGDPLTREQFAAIIANAAGEDVSQADRSVLERYPDSDNISDWAMSPVAWAVEKGIINGVELRDGTLELRATEPMTRSQMAAMITNAIDSGVL